MDIQSGIEEDIQKMSDTSNFGYLKVVLPLVASFLSLVGSTTIVCILLRRKRNRLSKTYVRIIFGMSSMDILSSTANLFATLPSPSDTPQMLSLMRFPGYGTTATCTVQGFFFHSGQIGTTLYYCALSIFYVVAVTMNTSEKVLKTRIEPFLHGIPLLYSFSSAIFLAVTENFNNGGPICWISPYPVTCRRDLDTCTRGRYAFLYRWIFVGIPVITTFFVVLTCMIRLICAVRKQERKMQRYNFGTPSSPSTGRRSSLRLSIGRHSITGSRSRNSNNNNSSRQNASQKTQRTTTQAFLYIAAFFVTFIFSLIFQLVYSISRTIIPVLFILQQTTMPAQGFFNFLVFIRPRIQNALQKNTKASFYSAFLEAIKSRGEDPNMARRRRSSIGRRSTVRISTGSCFTSEHSNKSIQNPAVRRMSVRSAVLQAQKEAMEEMNLSLSSDDIEDAVPVTSPEAGHEKTSFFKEEVHFTEGSEDVENSITVQQRTLGTTLRAQTDLEKLDLIDSDSVDNEFEVETGLLSSCSQDLPVADQDQKLKPLTGTTPIINGNLKTEHDEKELVTF